MLFVAKFADCISCVFAIQLDKRFCKIANAKKFESGTTAVTVVLGSKEFYVANTGLF
mgnify:CR=1 FL=1